MRNLLILFVGVFLMAGNAHAVAVWQDTAGNTLKRSELRLSIGKNIADLTPDANTQTATVNTQRCEAITVSCYGTNMTGLLQMCNGAYAQAAALDTTTCQSVNLTAIDCATDHSVQVEPAPAWIRLASVTNSGSSQNFQVVCQGSLK